MSLQVIGPTTQAEALAFYAARNLAVTPVRPTEKKGRLTGWSAVGHSATLKDFRPGDNIGVLNGTMPGDDWRFYDVDIDANSDRARHIVEKLLPATGWRYGRASKPRSHANYLARGVIRSRKYVGIGNKSIIEMRGITQKKTHTLSVAPGSTHETGEPIRFVEPIGDIGRIENPVELDSAVQYAAIGIVIADIWPEKNRHNLRLAFAKVLLEYGVPQKKVVAILEVVMAETSSSVDDVSQAVSSTAEALSKGQATAGASVIIELLGKDIINAIETILRISSTPDDGNSINIAELTTTMVDRAWRGVVSANDPPGLFKRDNDVLILRNSDNTCLNTLYEEQVKLEEPTLLQHVSGFRKIEVETLPCGNLWNIVEMWICTGLPELIKTNYNFAILHFLTFILFLMAS